VENWMRFMCDYILFNIESVYKEKG